MNKPIEGNVRPAGPETIMGNLTFLLDVDRVLLNTEIYYATNLTEFSGYPEDKEALIALRRLGRLAIFSEILEKDPRTFQLRKIQELGFIEYFRAEDTHIYNNKLSKLGEILRQYGGLIFLIDDNPDIIEEAKRLAALDENKNYELVTVWVKRGRYAEEAEKKGRTWVFPPDEAVKSLGELVTKVRERLSAQNPAA